MWRFLIVSAVSLASIGATIAGVAAAATLPRAHLRGFVCTKALEPAQRLVSVMAVMRPLTEVKSSVRPFGEATRVIPLSP
jgi:7-keto-8-aminopelargonate synthetase-like enzyme